jgi:hypothetical protein
MRELDEHIGDIYGQIVDLENAVMRDVEQQILAHQGPLLLVNVPTAINNQLAFLFFGLVW